MDVTGKSCWESFPLTYDQLRNNLCWYHVCPLGVSAISLSNLRQLIKNPQMVDQNKRKQDRKHCHPQVAWNFVDGAPIHQRERSSSLVGRLQYQKDLLHV